MRAAPLERALLKYCQVVDGFSDLLGKTFGWFIFIMVGMLCWEVLLRSVFNSPTQWVHEGSTYFFAPYFAFGGAYALRYGSMVNVDVLVNRLSPRTKAIIELITGLFSLFFLYVVFWEGLDLAIVSIGRLERSQTVWAPPIYPLKIVIFLGAFTLGIQLLVELLRKIIFLVKGQ
jgi:TRAP-type mannitol/chloroaromatic compound transport system permease small subunit